MMLRFLETEKLKTKKIVFEEVFVAQDAHTLEQLRDLSCKRKAVEDILNRGSVGAARRVSGVSTYQTEQDVEKLECYLPLLDDLIAHHDVNREHPQMIKWVSDLKIRWTSSLNSSSFLTQIGGGLIFYQANDLLFERFMILFVYGATLRKLGFELMPTDMIQSAKFYRKAAGVYNYLARVEAITLEKTVKVGKPSELSHFTLTALSLICLAEAQAVTAQRAEEKGTSFSLLAKLHCGITQFLDEAMQALCTGGHKDLSQRLMDFILCNKALHEFKSQKYLAEQFKAEGKFGISIGLLRAASANLMQHLPSNESWKGIFMEEISSISEPLRRLERENDFVWRDRVSMGPDLPIPEGKKIVQAIQFEPKLTSTKQLMFNLDGGKLTKSPCKGKSSHY